MPSRKLPEYWARRNCVAIRKQRKNLSQKGRRLRRPCLRLHRGATQRQRTGAQRPQRMPSNGDFHIHPAAIGSRASAASPNHSLKTDIFRAPARGAAPLFEAKRWPERPTNVDRAAGLAPLPATGKRRYDGNCQRGKIMNYQICTGSVRCVASFWLS